jgi:hypothetical protein
MAFTDRSDVFGALHEDGINRLVRHVMRQRPSLFNYGTRYILDNLENKPALLCAEIDASELVAKYGNPLLGVVDPLGVEPIADHLALNLLLQITELEIDFHPAGIVSLPGEFGGLPAQHFGVRARVCGGIGCPPPEFVDNFELPDDDEPDPEPVVPDVDELLCFCLQAFATGRFELVEADDTVQTMLRPVIGKVEIDDLQPHDLETAVECYLRLATQFGLARELSDVLADVIPGILEDLDEEFGLTLVPAPIAGQLRLNPAVEEDQVRIFINIEEVSP